MTTLQALVYGIIHGIAEFFPISAGAHTVLVPYLLGWPEPSGPFAGALALGALISLLIYFRHDWASMISCFIQVILFRKKPMTLDERLPLFLMLAMIPSVATWYYVHPSIVDLPWSPLWVAAGLAVFALPMWIADYLSRKNKGMFDWNTWDSLVVGISLIGMLVPGAGRPASALPGALIRNYNREAAAKFCFYLSAPLLAGSAIHHLRGFSFHAAAPMPDMTWLSFYTAIVMTVIFGLMTIAGFMSTVARKGFGRFVAYRFLIAAAVGVKFWLKSRAGV